jgi:hypothetical protein
MKVLKELPKSIYYSLLLRVSSKSKLLRNKETVPLIVSFTSISSRLNSVDLVVKCLYNQSVLPQKILLWLPQSLKNKIPQRLEKLQSNLFEIKYSHLDSSHKKLIHTIKEYPSKTIVTCDDDVIYDSNWLKNLYEEHLLYPKDIIANRAIQIKFDNLNEYLPIKTWKKREPCVNENRLLGIGAWGILYPSNSLSNIVFDEELFLRLTPKADDLWFKGMALLNRTLTRRSNKKTKGLTPIIGSQKVSLKEDNVKKNKNEIQWKSLSDHFNLKEILLKK